jgi:hypothetical protein
MEPRRVGRVVYVTGGSSMNKMTLFASIGISALATMLGCSTSQPAASAVDVPLAVPPPEFSYDLPLEPPNAESGFKACKLGTSCMAMDPRPFEACLLSTRECTEKAAEPLLVGEPEWVEPPAIIKTR